MTSAQRQAEIDSKWDWVVSSQPMYMQLYGTKPGFPIGQAGNNPLSPLQGEPGAPGFNTRNPFDHKNMKNIPDVGIPGHVYGEGISWPGTYIDETWQDLQTRTWIQTTKGMAIRSDGIYYSIPTRIRRDLPADTFF